MTKKRFLMVHLAGLMSVLLIGLPGTTQAQEAWVKMNPRANPPTVDAAREQCMQSWKVGSKLTAADCDEFADMLKEGVCSQISVPDDIVHPWLGGSDASVTVNRRKALGGDTPALACELGNGRTLVWYHQSVVPDGRACNNVAELPRSEPTVNLRPRLQVTRQSQPPQVIISGGVRVPLCCDDCRTHDVYTPQSTIIIPTNETQTYSVPGGMKMN